MTQNEQGGAGGAHQHVKVAKAAKALPPLRQRHSNAKYVTIETDTSRNFSSSVLPAPKRPAFESAPTVDFLWPKQLQF